MFILSIEEPVILIVSSSKKKGLLFLHLLFPLLINAVSVSNKLFARLLETVSEFIKNYFWWISWLFVNYLYKTGENQCWFSPVPLPLYMEIYVWWYSVMSWYLYDSSCFSSFLFLQRYEIKKEKSRVGCY